MYGRQPLKWPPHPGIHTLVYPFPLQYARLTDSLLMNKILPKKKKKGFHLQQTHTHLLWVKPDAKCHVVSCLWSSPYAKELTVVSDQHPAKNWGTQPNILQGKDSYHNHMNNPRSRSFPSWAFIANHSPTHSLTTVSQETSSQKHLSKPYPYS